MASKGWDFLRQIAKEDHQATQILVEPTFWTLDDLMIQTKDGRLISLGRNINEVQAQILDDVAPRWREGDCTVRHGLRNYELKARQFGVSTLMLALYFLGVINSFDTNAVVIADNDDNTAALFQKAHIFYEHLDPVRRPRKKYSSRRELAFADLRSTFRVLTAGRKGAGRSRTIQFLHCSEVAFWRDARTVMSGLMQAVPSSGAITIESTANGEGSESEQGDLVGGDGALFHVEYEKARAGRNGFEARFTPWYKLPSYTSLIPAGFALLDRQELERLVDLHGEDEGKALYLAECGRYLLTEYTDESGLPSEREYARRFGLSEGQLVWRRSKIDEPGQGPLFRQEYPTTEQEAFLLSGSAYFTAYSERDHATPREEMPAWWDHRGGYDWGKASPFSFHLGVWSPKGACSILEEAYAAGMTEEEQAQAIIEVLKKRGFTQEGRWWGIRPDARGHVRLTIYADPSIFPPKDPLKRVGRYRVEEFWEAGLYLVPALNSRPETNANARNYLQRRGALTIQRTCHNLLRTIPLARRDPRNPEDFVLTEDHAIDSGLRYLLACKPIKPELPDEVATREEIAAIEKRLAGMHSPIAGYSEDKRTNFL